MSEIKRHKIKNLKDLLKFIYSNYNKESTILSLNKTSTIELIELVNSNLNEKFHRVHNSNVYYFQLFVLNQFNFHISNSRINNQKINPAPLKTILPSSTKLSVLMTV